jgi:hypothetical protein
MNEAAEIVNKLLFSDDKAAVFAILDGASVGDLLSPLYEHQPEFECLYPGEVQPDIAEVAPYLVRLAPGSPFTAWVIAEGWGNHWGVFALFVDRRRAERRKQVVQNVTERRRKDRREREAPPEMSDMKRHFRRLLVVHDSMGKPLYFRYYDPRVLRVYLPTCNSTELTTLFGPFAYFLLEGGDTTTALQFALHDGGLTQSQHDIPQS